MFESDQIWKHIAYNFDIRRNLIVSDQLLLCKISKKEEMSFDLHLFFLSRTIIGNGVVFPYLSFSLSVPPDVKNFMGGIHWILQ